MEMNLHQNRQGQQPNFSMYPKLDNNNNTSSNNNNVVLPPLVHPLIYFNPEQQQQQQPQRLHLPPPLTLGSTSRSTSISSTGSSSISSLTSATSPTSSTLLKLQTPHYSSYTTLPQLPLFTPTPRVQQLEQCKWEGCTERFETPQLLYSHLCDVHVGRKAKNNLALKCKWDDCKVKVVKRDHITSHLRVHVAFKPFPCQSCHKKFKRPQDLKKHQKVHTQTQTMSYPTKRGLDEATPQMEKRQKYTLPPLESIFNPPQSWPLPPQSQFQLRNHQQNALHDLESLFSQLDLSQLYDPSVLEEGEILDSCSDNPHLPLYPTIAV